MFSKMKNGKIQFFTAIGYPPYQQPCSPADVFEYVRPIDQEMSELINYLIS